MSAQTRVIQKRPPKAVIIIAASLVYALCVQAHDYFFPLTNLEGAFHPWIGIALAILLKDYRSHLPGVIAGTLIINLLTGQSFIDASVLTLGFTIAVMAGAYLISFHGRYDSNPRSSREYLFLIMLGGTATALVSAMSKASLLYAKGALLINAVPNFFAQWWVGDILGITVITPLVLFLWRSTDENERFIFNCVSQEREDWLTYYDSLTGLPNRALFEKKAKKVIDLARAKNQSFALISLDLDKFKRINDSFGHSKGDYVLQEIARRMKSGIGVKSIVSRLGSDEFFLLVTGADSKHAAMVAGTLRDLIAEPINIDEQQVSLTASVGIAIFPTDGQDFDSIFKNANSALSQAKQEGRNCTRIFIPEMQAFSSRRLQLENALSKALELDQLLLHYQPQVSLQDGRTVGAEALLRWNHPELGMIPPSEFIPIAESCGLILNIGEWVLRTATHQLREWMDAGHAPMTISVNLSAAQLRHPALPQLVMEILNESNLQPQQLELELTETMTMENPIKAISVMDDLYKCGIRMSIDDFGTGHSSLAHLKQFKAHKLKIDRSFVNDIARNLDDKAIVGAVINLADHLGMQTIAEGVETEEQFSFLRENGCDEIQGHYFSQPLAAEQFGALLANEQIKQDGGAMNIM